MSKTENELLREAVRSYGRTIDRWGRLIIAATGSEDVTTLDGDGDWAVVEERLADVATRLREAKAEAWDEGAAANEVGWRHVYDGHPVSPGEMCPCGGPNPYMSSMAATRPDDYTLPDPVDPRVSVVLEWADDQGDDINAESLLARLDALRAEQ